MLLDCGTELMHDFIRRSLWLHLLPRHMGQYEGSKVTMLTMNVSMYGTYATQSVLCKASTGRVLAATTAIWQLALCCSCSDCRHGMYLWVGSAPIFALSSHGHELITTAI